MEDILIVGISTVDAIARPVDDYPGPGGLQFFDRVTFATGGCAVNCSIALAKMGMRCECVTRVGRDILGDLVLSELADHAVDHDGVVRDPQASTAFTFVAVGSDGERRFLHAVGSNATLCRADVPRKRLDGRKILFVTGVMLMDTLDGEQAAGLLADAQAAGATTLLDTVFVEAATRDAWRRRVGVTLPHLDYFVPSYPEASALSGEDDPATMARGFQKEGAKNVVIKLGQGGVFCRDATGREVIVPAYRVEKVVDATGAGDCWCAGFLVGLREGLPIDEAGRLGNAVSAFGIQAPGASTGVKPLREIRAFMAANAPGMA